MGTRTGDLPRGQAEWMSAHARELAVTLPRPGYRWQWADCAVPTGDLRRLRDYGLIVQTGERRWRTTERCIQAIADYGGGPVEAVGVPAGQATLRAQR